MPSEELTYGGQAVIEGVMMRGKRTMTVAVRAPDGDIIIHNEPLDPRIYQSHWSKIPFLRGLVLLWDALVLGVRALLFSANVALEEEEVELKGPGAWLTIGVGLILAVVIFFLLPVAIVSLVDRYIHSALVSNLAEGLVRLGLVIAYIAAIGFWPDIRRVFAYHGAEHKAINAYEAGEPLEIERVRPYSTAHPRCGTGFILWVVVISIIVFAFLGRPPLLLRFLSRTLLIPVIVMLSYETLKFSSAHRDNPLMRLLLWPALSLQSLTTRQPDDRMLEVALVALRKLLEMEEELAISP